LRRDTTLVLVALFLTALATTAFAKPSTKSATARDVLTIYPGPRLNPALA